MDKIEDCIRPAKLTDNETEETYELDFSRESVKFAESRGFKIDEIGDFPATKIEELFYLAFRKNHRSVSREKTDKLIAKMGGVPENLLKRLTQLYVQAQTSNTVQTDEEFAKNSKVALEL